MRPKSDLHGYQNRLITTLYENDAMIAIVPMGGGKTVSTLTAMQELLRDGHIRAGVVMAPKKVAKLVWPREVDEWEHLQGLRVVLVVGTPTQRKRLLDGPGDVFVVGIDNTQWLTEEMETWEDDDPRFDLLAIDEISRYKSPTGKRSRALAFVADCFKMRWGLTGTPRPNSELDFYMQVRLIARRVIWPEAFINWRMLHFMPDDPYTQLSWHVREDHADRIKSDMASICCAVDPSELPPQPDLVPVEHWVDLPPRAAEAYKDMMDHHLLEAEGDVVIALNAAVAAGKLDQIAQGFIYKDGETMEVLHEEKLDALRDLLEGVAGEQAMITYWYKEDLLQIQRLLPMNNPVLGSITSDARAERAVDMWNAGDIQFLPVHPASAGHGLNCQKSHAGHIIHYCPTWSAELFAQVSARIARQGNNRERVLNHMILARGTLDEVKLMRVAGKITKQEAFARYVGNRDRG